MIGTRRATALGPARLIGCADVDSQRAEALSRKFSGAVAFADWRSAVDRKDVDVVIVATPNAHLAAIAEAAATAGKHVLVEKPGARCVMELDGIQNAAKASGVLVRIGFNHRYHPSVRKALAMVSTGEAGPLMYVRARYGHGGRLGYEREWRANPVQAGGGELLDQGVHLIDLARLLLGDFAEVVGFVQTYFWAMPVEDNAFLLLKTADGRLASLHASCTEWKNLFSFEIFGRKAKLSIEGLGGSYGTERLSLYKMLPEMGPPETTIWEFPRGDDSWSVEFSEFLDDIRRGRPSAAGLQDARATLEVVERVYQQCGRTFQQ